MIDRIRSRLRWRLEDGEKALVRMAPRELLWTPLAWLRAGRLLCVACLCLAGVLLTLPLTWPSSEAFLLGGQPVPEAELLSLVAWASVGIDAILLVVVYRAAVELATIEVNTAIARHLRAAGDRALQGLVNTPPRERRLFDDIPDLEPPNVSEPRPAMMRLYDNVRRQASDRHFEQTAMLQLPYRAESNTRLGSLDELQTLALRAGILGTFVGLCLALSGIPEFVESLRLPEAPEQTVSDLMRAVSANQSGLMRLVGALFGGLRVAFGTSVSGLAVAISASLIAIVVRSKQDEYFREMERATVALVSVALHTNVGEYYLGAFDQLHQELETINGTLTDHASKARDQTTAVRDGIDNLKALKERFDRYVKEHETFLVRLRALYDVRGLENLRAQVAKAFEEAGKGVVAGVCETLDTRVVRAQQEIGTKVSKTHDSVVSVQNTTEKTSRVVGSLPTADDVDRSLRDVVSADLRRLERHVGEIGNAVGEVVGGPMAPRPMRRRGSDSPPRKPPGPLGRLRRWLRR